MRIRYKLFLWVCAVFFIFSVFSFIAENYITHHKLREDFQNFEDSLVLKNEELRQRWEKLTQLLFVGSVETGSNADKVLTELVFATDQSAFLLADGKVLEGYDIQGKSVEKTAISSLPIEKIASGKSGFFNWGKEDYFFSRLTPSPALDLHFVLVTPKAKLFEVIDSLQGETHKLIDTLSLYMHILAIIALAIALLVSTHIAKKVELAIQNLTGVIKKVNGGMLEQVEMTCSIEVSNDEIDILNNSFADMIEGFKEKEKVRVFQCACNDQSFSVLNKVISPEIAAQILQHPLQLGGEEKTLTVLFADIRGFTKLTENMPPQAVIELLNQCMTKISTLVDEHNGVIDKYVGDEAMALFGFPVQGPQSVADAISCGLRIVETTHVWNEEREKQNLPKVEFGVGIHTGTVVAGNMGAENRLSYTVLGRNVNLTARLCSFAKPGEVLISGDAFQSPGISDLFFVEKAVDATFKGFTQSIPTYKVVGKKLQ